MSDFPPNTSALDACVDMTSAHSKLAALGFDTVLRYGAAAAWKCITPAEARSMQQNNLKLALIYELTAKDILLGASEGAKAGAHVLAFAPSVGLARSTGAAIYVTADFDIVRSQLPAALDYLHGFASSCPGYDLGLYANGLLNDTAYAAGLVKYRWITQSMGFTGTRESLNAGRYELVQRLPAKVCGLDTDPDSLREAGLDIGARVPFGSSVSVQVATSAVSLTGKPVSAAASMLPTAQQAAQHMALLQQIKQLVSAL